MVIVMMGINDAGPHIPYEPATTSKVTLFLQSLRTYKLARLLWLHIVVNTKEIGFFYLPIIRLEEAYAEPITTEDVLKKAIELNPKSDSAYANLGKCYMYQGKISQAEDVFKRATELNPRNDSAYYGLGWCYHNQGKLSQAEDVFKRAIELNPKNEQAYFELGTFYQKQGKLSQAEDAIKKVIELNPKNDNAYVELGWCYEGQGKLSQVEDAFKKAVGINPESDIAYGACSILYEEIGKPELAREYAKKANSLRLKYYIPVTANNYSYRKLKEILTRRGIKLVCMQYPMRSIEPLKKIFEADAKGIVFVDNEEIFRDAVKKDGASAYFKDMFGGDFGHCTKKGNQLLAENIANVILEEVFHK